MTYRLALPTSSVIHHVFHVSQLKKMVNNNRAIGSQLPDTFDVYQVLEVILDRGMIHRGMMKWLRF
jgi:hypothetical protein